jgi:two-component system response regulator FixJ
MEGWHMPTGSDDIASTGRPLVVVVEAHSAAAERLAALLGAAGYAVHRCADTADLLARGLPPAAACIIASLEMPGEAGGMALLGWLRTAAPGVPVLAGSRRATIRATVEALRLGALDVLEMPCERVALLAAVADCIARGIQAHAKPEAQGPAWQARLSERERQVMELVVAGQGNKAIGAALGISPRTVEIHRANLMQKAGARGVSDLVRLVLAARRP